MNPQEGEFLYHAPCPHCSSSDAYSVYDDGHGYCFSCQAYDKGTDMQEKAKKPSALIEGEAKALTKRGITLDTCRKYGYQLGNSGGGDVQIAPYFRDGQLVAQHCRTRNKDFFWLGDAKKVELFGQHLWSPGGRRLIITEGEIDALTIAQTFGLKWPVVSVPSGAAGAYKALAHNMEWVNTFDEIVLAFDNDQPGKAAVTECVPLFDPGKVKVMTYPEGCKDANDMLTNGYGEKIAGSVFQAAEYRPDGIIAWSELKDRLRKARPPGHDLPWPGLNTYFEGFKKKRIYLMTAGSGIGKSTIAHEIGYHFIMQHGLTLGVLALEESVEEAAERYISLHLNKPLQVRSVYEEVPEDTYWQAYEELGKDDRVFFYEHFGSNDVEGIVNKLRFLRKSLGCDYVILDHISIMVSGLEETNESERKTIDRLMTNLRKMVESTGLGLIAIVHLKRPQQGLSWSQGRVPTLSDLRGSGALEQLSDAVIAFSRDQTNEEESDKIQAHVLKNRWERKTGKADDLLYVMETGRVISYDVEAAAFNKEVDDDTPF